MKTPNNDKTYEVSKFQKPIAIIGISIPILYVCVALIMGLLETGYSHRIMMMSILGGVGGWE